MGSQMAEKMSVQREADVEPCTLYLQTTDLHTRLHNNVYNHSSSSSRACPRQGD